MSWKELLKPTLPKVVLALVLFFVFSFIWSTIYVTLDAWFFGFPFTVVAGGGMCGSPASDPECGKLMYDLVGILLDTITFYAFSSAILKIVGKR